MAGLVVVGSDGTAREAVAWLEDLGRGSDLVGFLDDSAVPGAEVAGYPVLGGIDWLSSRRATEVVAALRSPVDRAHVVCTVRVLGAPLATIVHPSARTGPNVTLAQGVIVGPGVLLAGDVTVGTAAIISAGVMVGHDSRVGDFVSLAIGVRVADRAKIDAQADVGIGAVVARGVTIGRGAVIDPGATVVDDVPAARGMLTRRLC